MRLCWFSVCVALCCCGTSTVNCTAKRTIYTLFSDKKTWNEAKAICESQYGQLFKPKVGADLEEIQFLDTYTWELAAHSNLAAFGKIWNGIHKPFSNSTLEYQDCEVKTGDIPVVSSDPSGRCGAFTDTTWDLEITHCTDTYSFICERNEGDCWFEPFPDKQPSIIDTFQLLAVNMSASECAYHCRNYYSNAKYCWGFQYDPTQSMGCLLYSITDSVAQANAGTSASVLYVVPANRVDYNGSLFYARRCFEGVQDSVVYSGFINTDSTPNTNCSYHVYPGDTNDTEICYCPTNTQPPIPAPISSEAKAEEYVKELTIDTSNTSAAQRKLISAEDDRPSAQGVGYVGVALMTVVFGGLFLMDLNVIFAEFKKLFTGVPGEMPTVETQDSSEC